MPPEKSAPEAERRSSVIESFFGLHGIPFGRSVPVAELLRTDGWDELHARMLHTARARGFGVFTGDTGTGKTTSLRRFAGELDPNRYRVLYVCDSFLTPRNFYWEVLHQLGCTPRFYRGDAKRQFQNISLSYSYVTASLPVCAFLMIVSTAIKLKKQITDFPSTLRGGGADVV